MRGNTIMISLSYIPTVIREQQVSMQWCTCATVQKRVESKYEKCNNSYCAHIKHII